MDFKSLALRAGIAVFIACASNFASAQYPSNKTSLITQIGLSTFGAGSGNDCWGYVSPTGREYAIMGLNNQVAFIEVTNPTSPVVVATIPHTASTWGDIKVYQHYAYAVSEATGTGIQVIDMSLIDAGVVTLVRTIPAPGRTHNVALDEVSGFLYTCGSRDGTGTTMCFSLADPANPTRVGANSLTTNYQHDAQIVTYTSGPYAGKQILFGCSESRGVDIYDVTDKNNPVLIKRVTYPNMGYCHQGWLSADRKYFYVDDEFDENNLQVTTRSAIFNVESLENASFVGFFTSGVPAIDHNQYVHEGFTFQANYRSGLRIFDLADNPESPVQVGFFDTYPANDNRGYDGAWSTYPFFPSGNVVVSDINRGFFMVNVLDATTRSRYPVEGNILSGHASSGTLADVKLSDDQYLWVSNDKTKAGLPIQMEFTSMAVDTEPRRVRVSIESKVESKRRFLQSIELYDWTSGNWVPAGSSLIHFQDGVFTSDWMPQPARFVNSVTREVRSRVSWTPFDADDARTTVGLDVAKVEITQ